MTENLATQVREIVCPDGTQYQVFSDGSWIHETWDGQFVRSSLRDDNSTDPAEIIAKLGL